LILAASTKAQQKKSVNNGGSYHSLSWSIGFF
jgi:hypothetical protein